MSLYTNYDKTFRNRKDVSYYALPIMNRGSGKPLHKNQQSCNPRQNVFPIFPPISDLNKPRDVGQLVNPKSVIRGICFVVVNVIYRLTGSCKLKFLMTAIRSLNFQYAWFQHVTRNTTKMGFSNDRFGLILQNYTFFSGKQAHFS